MERILLIIPPYVNYGSFISPAFNDGTILKGSKQYRNVPTDMPIGLISMSAYLKGKVKVEIEILDFNIVLHKLKDFEFESFSKMYQSVFSDEKWLDYSPSIIGISALFTPSYYNMLDIGQVAKETYPEAIIISGGGVPTNMYKEIFAASTAFDALCYGEGEKPLLGLVSADDKFSYLEANSSWITRTKAENNQTFTHDFVNDLDEIPFYDYEILTTSDYGLSPTISTFAAIDDKSYPFHVATSRGCPHLCSFCASHSVHGRTMRYHSVARVKSDLSRLKNKFGVSKVVFQDDHFMSDKNRALEIINIAKDFEMTAFFQSGLALYALDRKVLEALKSVGLTQLVLSVESGSNRVLREIMHKPLDLSIVKQVAEDCRALGIASDVTVLIGLPGETKQDIEDALEFLKTLDATWFRINVATPLPGSEMLDICISNGFLKGGYIDCDFKRAVIETEEFTAEYIQEKAYLMNLELNFVRNSDIRRGNYENALLLLDNVLRVKNDHAFAYYYTAQCHEKLGNNDKYHDYMLKYEEILRQSEFWTTQAKRFGLPSISNASQ